MADNFGIYNISAELEAAPSASIYGALAPPSGNINLRRKPERDARDAQEIASAQSSNFNVFVLPEISSSRHEVSSVNSFFSGTQALESTSVPASGSTYYSKQSRFVKKTYYLTASAGLPITPANETSPATDEYAARGTYIPLSGSYRNNSMFNPSVFEIDIPDRGKIVDLKVWVEFVHDHRGGVGPAIAPFIAGGGSGGGPTNRKQGLQGVQIALRNSNVQFDFAHPLWNEGTIKNFQKWPTNQVQPQYTGVPELLKSSYLLWAGHSCEEDLGYALGKITGSLPDNNITLRILTSASVGPGISGSAAENYGDSAYRYGKEAWRTIDSHRINGQNWVLYSTKNDPGNTQQFLMTAYDSGIETEPLVYQSMMGSASYSGNSAEVFHHPRIRIQKDSQFVHAACTGPGAGAIRYSIKKVGDTNQYHWRTKVPVLNPGHSEAFLDMALGPYEGWVDGFLDFALDTNNKPHFVFSAWRGDLGVAELHYMCFTGSTADYDNTPSGCTLVTNAGIPGLPYKHDFYIASQSLSDEPVYSAPNGIDSNAAAVWPDIRFGVLDSAFMKIKETATDLQAGNLGAYCRIGIGSDNIIHIVYTDVVNKTVKYAKKAVSYESIPFQTRGPPAAAGFCTGWSFEYIKQHTTDPYWPTHTWIAIDTKNKPHVVYHSYDGSKDNLYYAFSGSNGWTVELVESVLGIKDGTKIALDLYEAPVISSIISNFDGKGNEAVMIYRSGSSGWTREPVYLGNNDNPRDTSIVFDSNNKMSVYTTGGRLAVATEGSEVEMAKYFEFDTDIDMRTVFTDSSLNTNPRNLSSLYQGPKDEDPGRSELPGLLIKKPRAYPSPFSSSIRLLQTPGVWGSSQSHIFEPDYVHTSHLSGANCPWMFDSRIPPGIFHGLNYFSTITSSLGLTPPLGWLSGPGGTTNINEFPTIGANLGPADIQPVYPLLDDVFVEKIIDQPQLGGHDSILPSHHGKIVGFRPGLRGTEINGKWQLLIGTAGDASSVGPGATVSANSRAGIWFRQFRLEITYDEGKGLKYTYPSKGLRFKNTGNARRAGKRRISIMSGSSAWDVGVNYVFAVDNAQYGRSVGITDSTGSSNFSVFSQITGSLVDLLSGSGGIYNVRNSYLSNEFGTPYIPISSGSAFIPSFDTFSEEEVVESKKVFQETLNPKTLVPKDNTLRAHLSRAQVLKTTRDVMLSKIKFTK